MAKFGGFHDSRRSWPAEQIALEAFELARQIGGALVAHGAVGLEQAAHDFAQLEGQIRGGGLKELRGPTDGRNTAALPGGRLMKDESERKQIASAIQFLSPHLLRRHISQSPWSRPGSREAV